MHVDAPSGTTGSLEEAAGHSFLPGEIRSGSGKLPPSDKSGGQPSRQGDSSVPASAMRFFESLAAEATLNKQMEGDITQPSRPVAPPPAPPAKADASPPPPPEVIRRLFEPAAGATAQSAPPVALQPPTVSVRSDAFASDEILELPSLDPIVPPGPAHLNNVLEIDSPGHVDAAAEPAAEPSTRTAPIVSERRPPVFRTEPMVSPEPKGSTLDFASPFAPTVDRDDARPDTPLRIAPPPRPIVLPDRTPTIAPLAASGAPTEQATVDPFAPRLPAPAPVEPFAPAATPPPPQAVEAAPVTAPVANRLTPAEMAQQYVTPWVAPEVEDAPPPPRRRLVGPLTLLALLAAAGILYAVWKLGIRDGFNPKPAPQAAAPASAPAPSAPTPSTAQPQTPSSTGAPSTASTNPQPEAQTPPAEPPKPPSGSGGFTIQVRSSPNESDSVAFANSLKSAGFDAYVMRADLGAKGVWYRVRVGRFDTKAEASQALSKLRGTGQTGEAIIQQYESP